MATGRVNVNDSSLSSDYVRWDEFNYDLPRGREISLSEYVKAVYFKEGDYVYYTNSKMYYCNEYDKPVFSTTSIKNLYFTNHNCKLDGKMYWYRTTQGNYIEIMSVNLTDGTVTVVCQVLLDASPSGISVFLPIKENGDLRFIISVYQSSTPSPTYTSKYSSDGTKIIGVQRYNCYIFGFYSDNDKFIITYSTQSIYYLATVDYATLTFTDIDSNIKEYCLDDLYYYYVKKIADNTFRLIKRLISTGEIIWEIATMAYISYLNTLNDGSIILFDTSKPKLLKQLNKNTGEIEEVFGYIDYTDRPLTSTPSNTFKPRSMTKYIYYSWNGTVGQVVKYLYCIKMKEE